MTNLEACSQGGAWHRIEVDMHLFISPTMRTFGVLAALACSASVGLHIILSKLVIDQVSPILCLFYLGCFSCFFGLIPILLEKKRSQDAKTPAYAFVLIYLHSLCASGGMIFGWEGLSLLNPTVASFLGRFEVLVSVSMAALILGERFSLFKTIGFIIGIIGVLLLTSTGYQQSSVSLKDPEFLGILFILLSAVCYGSCEIFAFKAIRHFRLRNFVFLRGFFNLIHVSILAAVFIEDFSIQSSHLALIGLAAFFGPYLGRQLFMMAVSRISLSLAVGLNQTQPLFAAFFGLVFYLEAPSALQWVGGAFIICGSIFLVHPRAEAKKILAENHSQAKIALPSRIRNAS